MRKTLLLGAAFAGALLVACGGEGGTDLSGIASIRAVHASRDSGPVDVLVQGVPVETNLLFGQSFPSPNEEPAPLPANDAAQISILSAGTSTALVTGTADLEPNRISTFIVAGLQNTTSTPDALRLLTIQDSRSTLLEPSANVRFVHASLAWLARGGRLHRSG